MCKVHKALKVQENNLGHDGPTGSTPDGDQRHGRQSGPRQAARPSRGLRQQAQSGDSASPETEGRGVYPHPLSRTTEMQRRRMVDTYPYLESYAETLFCTRTIRRVGLSPVVADSQVSLTRQES